MGTPNIPTNTSKSLVNQQLANITNYIRTDLTDTLHDKFGFRTDFEVVSEKNIKKILRQTKK